MRTQSSIDDYVDREEHYAVDNDTASPRYYYDSDDRAEAAEEDGRGSTTNLFDAVLHAQGIDRYVDPRCLQREVADAHDLRTGSAMDRAARRLQTASSGGRGNNRYSDHLGGYKEYSDGAPRHLPNSTTATQQPVPSPRGTTSNTPSSTAWQARKVPKPPTHVQDDFFDETVYVTTL